MPHSNVRKNPKKPEKPRPDFPLFPHARGYWAKKVRGKLHYFGRITDDPQGEAALQLWVDQKDALLAGRKPRIAFGDGIAVAELCDHFAVTEEQQRDAGEIQPRTFTEYLANCQIVVNLFGENHLVEDLGQEDFQDLRNWLAKRCGVHRLSKEIRLVRMIFKHGLDAGLIDKPVRFGPTFKPPEKRIIRAHKQKHGPRMFEPEQIRLLLAAADQPLKAMILLGINCGFGNHDCGTLPQRAVNLKTGWIDFPRPKTAIERRCPLWPETVRALKEALTQRPKAKQREHDDLVFITKYGEPWSKDTSTNPVSQEFRKLLDAVDASSAQDAKQRRVKPPPKIYRRGLGFYALRHTFETIGGESRDQVAVNHIMGHADASMAGVYRERISDDRLRNVVYVIHRWLFPRQKAR